jgi:hypothetical protein
MRTRFILALLSSILLVGVASAGPITVLTEWGDSTFIFATPGPDYAQLVWGGPGPTVTVPAGQTTASQVVGGLFPIMQFSNLAQYQAQSSKIVSIPATPVQLYVKVWDGAYGAPGVPFKQLYVNATVSGQISPTAGRNTVNWQFAAMPVQVTFGDTVVTVAYQPILMPASTPLIQFEDGTPSLGTSWVTYYPTMLEAEVTVSPEPSSAVLLAGLTLGGLVARRCRRVVPAK